MLAQRRGLWTSAGRLMERARALKLRMGRVRQMPGANGLRRACRSGREGLLGDPLAAAALARPCAVPLLHHHGSAVATKAAANKAVGDNRELVLLVEANLAQGNKAMGKSIANRVLNGEPSVYGLFWIVVGHFLALFLRIDKADLAPSQLRQVFLAKAMNHRRRGRFKVESLLTILSTSGSARFKRDGLGSQVDRLHFVIHPTVKNDPIHGKLLRRQGAVAYLGLGVRRLLANR